MKESTGARQLDADALQLIADVLRDLNNRVYMLEADEEGFGCDQNCEGMLNKLEQELRRGTVDG